MAANKRNTAHSKPTHQTTTGADRGGITKTAFVLAWPADTPAVEIVAAADQQGMQLSAKHVYKIRSANRAKLEKTSSSSGGRDSAANGGFRTASAYIKAQPLDMGTMDVINSGRSHGFEINRHLIYVTRAAMRKKLAQGRPLTQARPRLTHAFPTDSIESQFRRLVVELGVSRARSLVADVENKWQSLVVRD
jgi:hypothetical protein